jgi:putative tonB-linked outer membrane protein
MKLQRFLTIAVLLFAGSVFAQSRTVEGTVSYGKAPIKGITIAVQGSAKTTKTDDKGHYKIDLAPSESTLIFTGEGLISQYVKLKKKQTLLDVTLEFSDMDLAIAKGLVDKRDISNAQVTMTPSGNIQGTMDIKHIIEGKAPGVTYRDGYVYIRNEQCLLYMVDGSEVENLLMLNPSDIDEVTIVKDGTASVYGGKGINGVVLITTKSAKIK